MGRKSSFVRNKTALEGKKRGSYQDFAGGEHFKSFELGPRNHNTVSSIASRGQIKLPFQEKQRVAKGAN